MIKFILPASLSVLFCLLATPVAFAGDVGTDDSDKKIPDILTLPRLSKSTPAGAYAWATVDQLRPAEPQTGFRGLPRKQKKIEELLSEGDGPNHFPDKLYKYLYTEALVPVVIGRV